MAPTTTQQDETQSTTMDVSFMTTTTAPTTTQQGVCLCPVYIAPNDTVTIDKLTEQIKKEMLIDTKNTSAFRRSLTCAEDPRPSAAYIGAVAATMMTLIGCVIILPDFLTTVKSTSMLCRPANRC
ncbi:uncharacterized protein [Argopecten irradians]|uniref:uncharacterized protein isoform X2 n=1 Tax=Argopecten irradians TaxID=31199 RepID=UPI0037179B5E